jgi:hypothetical protein
MSLRELALGYESVLPSKTPLTFRATNVEDTTTCRLVLTGRNLAKVTVEDVLFNGKSLLAKGGLPASAFEASAKNVWLAAAAKLPAGGTFELKILNQGDPVGDLRDTTDLRARMFVLGVGEATPALDAIEAL